MKIIEKFSISIVVLSLLVIIVFMIGWVKSIINLVGCDFTSPYKCEAVYGVGTIVPFIGGVVGHMDFTDK